MTADHAAYDDLARERRGSPDTARDTPRHSEPS
jgi:hypothetical protein